MPALQDCLFPAAGNLFPPEISVKAERKNENRRLSGLSLMRLLSRALRFIMRRVNRASMSILTAAVSAMPLLFVHLCFKDFWSLREEMLESDGARKKLLRAVYYAYMSKEKFFIGSKAVFSSKPVFPHGTAGVFISEGARFGTCCTSTSMQPSVRTRSRTAEGKDRRPSVTTVSSAPERPLSETSP